MRFWLSDTYRVLDVVEDFSAARGTSSVVLGHIFSLDLDKELLPFRGGVRNNSQGRKRRRALDGLGRRNRRSILLLILVKPWERSSICTSEESSVSSGARVADGSWVEQHGGSHFVWERV